MTAPAATYELEPDPEPDGPGFWKLCGQVFAGLLAIAVVAWALTW